MACRYMRKQTTVLLKQVGAIRRGESGECVRKARVASRRLRIALGIFDTCFRAKKVKRWRKHLRRLTRDLGAARDKDVQIVLVAGVIENLAANDNGFLPGLERLLLRLRQQRAALQPNVVKAIDRLDASCVLAQMRGEFAQKRASMRNEARSLENPRVFRRGMRQIRKKLVRLLTLQSCLDDAHAESSHHRMRIAAKRVRYTIEIYSAVFRDQFPDVIKTLKTMQSLLGEVHDCDVWRGAIDGFMADERRRTEQYFGSDEHFEALEPGLEYLRGERIAHRRKTFDELAAFWKETQGQRSWQEMIRLAGAQSIGSRSSVQDTGAACVLVSCARVEETMQETKDHKPMENESTAGESPQMELPGTLYQRGTRWWWRVRLPGEDKSRARALKPAGSRTATTDGDLAREIAREMWRLAEATEASEASKVSPDVEAIPSGLAEVEDGPIEVQPRLAKTAVCECCGSNHLLHDELVRIDSGQLLCAACLAELRGKASER